MDTVRKFWDKWKQFGQVFGDFIGRLVLTVFYFTIFLPFGLGVRFFSDPLGIKPGHRGEWVARTTKDHSLDDARRLS